MNPFDEWLSSSQYVSVRKYADRLSELGASWDTFLSRNPEAVANDLVKSGIPLLAAMDIVEVASDAAKQIHAPMAVFWDLENMPIPATSSGRDVSTRLKSILKPYGDLVKFRGYASIGLNLIPQQKRSELQLSGCLLVDCPHNGRKEVVDKMIIVDALNFAMQNLDGATLCFVTGDVDYAYLLVVLQQYRQFRTIVISKGTLQAMLDANCDMKMRWETDILKLRSPDQVQQDLGLPSASDPSISSDGPDPTLSDAFEPLTAHEEWIDDVQFLQNIIRREGASSGSVLKAIVGNLLRQTNPARFPRRESVKSFLSRAIERGVIREAGEGALKELSLPVNETNGTFPAISLSARIPMALSDVPEKVIQTAAQRPCVIFIKWKFCPPGTNLPSKVFVQQKDGWGFLMFATLTDAQRTVSEFPWLRNGILVDWRKIDSDGGQLKIDDNLLGGSSSAEKSCTLCNAIRSDVQLRHYRDGLYACAECIAWETMCERDKESGAHRVIEFMQFLAANDEIIIPEAMLRKQLYLKDELGCKSRKWGALWIKQAVQMGCVVYFKLPGNTKAKILCLASHLQEASCPFPPEQIDTSVEESTILEMLLKGERDWTNRLDVIQTLKERYPNMNHPYMRKRVLQNGYKKGLLYVAKDPYGHTVGLSIEAAELGLATLHPQDERQPQVEGTDTSESSLGQTDNFQPNESQDPYGDDIVDVSFVA